MPKGAKPRRSTKRQTVGIVAIAVGVIGVSIIVTLLFRGDLDLSFVGFGRMGSGGSGEYQNITMTDAQLSCRDMAKSKYGKRLKYISVDAHSSRFEHDVMRYKIYFSMGLYPGMLSGGSKAIDFHVNCFVDGSRGNVTHFDTAEDKPARSAGSDNDKGGFFGF